MACYTIYSCLLKCEEINRHEKGQGVGQFKKARQTKEQFILKKGHGKEREDDYPASITSYQGHSTNAANLYKPIIDSN